MGHHLKAETAEQANCRERGTTPAKVKADLTALRNLLGAGGAADRLGVGKSTVGNVIGGHSSVGPTILAALYGDGGCTLKPDLAALLIQQTEPVQTPQPAAGPAAEEPLDPSHDTTAAGIVSALVMQPVEKHVSPALVEAREWAEIARKMQQASTFDESKQGLDKLSVGDLLRNAERRRDALLAQLAGVDEQIKAVISLAAGAA